MHGKEGNRVGLLFLFFVVLTGEEGHLLQIGKKVPLLHRLVMLKDGDAVDHPLDKLQAFLVLARVQPRITQQFFFIADLGNQLPDHRDQRRRLEDFFPIFLDRLVEERDVVPYRRVQPFHSSIRPSAWYR